MKLPNTIESGPTRSSEIRSAFLRFFEERGHTVVPSSSLVPAGDPTLLFTNAGMVQFKDVFLGIEKRSYARAVTSQKCVRAGGKHNDLDNVGFTRRHHTFFEMLGNFSFGDYFKEEAMKYAWEFLTGVLELPQNRLWVTVFREDDEAERLWRKVAGLPSSRIVKMGEKDNFWAMGDTGPCGPCSELILDRGEDLACGSSCGIGSCDCDRWLELWNLVFMQYSRDAQGNLTPLPRPSIDTGMGLERITSVMQGADSNFDTDLFIPIIRKVEEISGKKAGEDEPVFPYRVIADHVRACSFLASDGVTPSNEGRGYVMRRILRRAVRFGRALGISQPFTAGLVSVVGQIMQDAYPEILARGEEIGQILETEEVRFMETLEAGSARAREFIEEAKARGEKVLSGERAFVLYDTFGFPIDLTRDMAREAGMTVDEKGFEDALERQRERARASRKAEIEEMERLAELLKDVPATRFCGYSRLEADVKILAMLKDGERVRKLGADEEGVLVFDVSPFYATAGGQVADQGILTLPASPGEEPRLAGVVTGVRKSPLGAYLHTVKASGETLMEGQTLKARVDEERRRGLETHHTATHLLHAALRKVLGPGALQSGSLVLPSRLRFDFAHGRALTPEERREIEKTVNSWVRSDLPVMTEEMKLEDARAKGAVALFGEKYGEVVRVVEVPGVSCELCGGTHLKRTGEIGFFKILSEGAVGAGLRRIEAVAGKAYEDYALEIEDILKGLAERLEVPRTEILSRIDSLMAEMAHLREESRKPRSRGSEIIAEILRNLVEVPGTGNKKIAAYRLDNMAPDEMRTLGDDLREKGASVIILGSRSLDKAHLLVMVREEDSRAGVDARSIVRAGATVLGGSGGGRADLAQAGGKSVERLDEAIAQCVKKARELVETVSGNGRDG